MRISGIDLTNWLTHRHLSLSFSALTVIAGPNGSGKSSIADAIGFGMLSELRRVDAKGDRPKLLSDGAEKGSVAILCGHEWLERDIASGKMTRKADLGLPEGAVTEAAPVLLNPSRFARLEPDARRALLLKVMRVKIGPEALLAELKVRGNAAELVDSLPLSETVDEWLKRAGKGATEARGAWKAVTGETYGAQKAEGWAPQVAPPPSEEEITRANGRIAELEAEIGAYQREMGEIDGRVRQAREHAERMERFRERAGTLKEAEAAHTAAKKKLDKLTAEMIAARDKLAEVRGRVADAHAKCPHCAGALQVQRDGTIAAYELPDRPASAKEVTAAEDAYKKAVDVADAAGLAETGALDAVGIAKAAQDAINKLAVPSGIFEADGERRSELDQKIVEGNAALGSVRARVAKMREQAQEARRAAQVAAQAAGAHRMVQAWTKIAEALAPDGIPGEMLGKALGPFNATLREQAAATGWPQVTITPDISVVVANRVYGLLCESEQWRADAMIGATMAQYSGMRFLVLDRFDVLDVPSRKPGLVWLYSLAKTEAVDTVMVLGTLKEPPRVPDDVAVHWLGDAAEDQQEAA